MRDRNISWIYFLFLSLLGEGMHTYASYPFFLSLFPFCHINLHLGKKSPFFSVLSGYETGQNDDQVLNS